MSKKTPNARAAWRAVTLCLPILVLAWSASAQIKPQGLSSGAGPSPSPEAKPSPAPEVKPAPEVRPAPEASPEVRPTPQSAPTPTLERRFFRNVLRDQAAIWTSPFHMGHGDAKWLAPLGVSAAVFFATDRRTAGEMAEGGENTTRLRVSKDISQAGSFYATGGAAAAFYLIGQGAHNARARETGLLAAEALVDSQLVVEALKAISQRQRPRTDHASGEFFDGGSSFPSGHAISVWSFASVVAEEYGRRHPLLRFGIYGLAAAVSFSRFTGRNHFLSDALVGSALGYGIGHYVYRKHHDTSLDSDDGAQKKTSDARRKLPLVAPIFSRAERSYGLGLAWDF
ncbi:MAG: phosphatase PAP2 family protein [Acidobacteriota bacterium]|nr:phosphatase PAP2 family protein [Acidobacteriota bacterium]MDQ5835348.1 phosphatase PAP2 family protein [Acidobacteriota bacterium]